MTVQLIRKSGFVLFGILAITDLLFIALQQNDYRYFTKPLLVPVLLLSIFINLKSKKQYTLLLLVLGAFTAGTAGDILLLESDKNLSVFAYGLASFLIMQVLYFVYFLRINPIKKQNLISLIALATLLYVYSFFFIKFLSPYLGELKIPVIIYAVVISSMLLAAINLFYSPRVYKTGITYFIPGAVLLVISDSLLAINKFYMASIMLEVVVMAFYLTGQLFMALGFINHINNKRKKLKRRPQQNNREGVLQLE